MNLALLFESKYGHTLWISDKGKLIDISNTSKVHYQWATDNKKQFKTGDKGLDVYAMAESSGWIRVQNHPRDITFTCMKPAAKKHRKLIFDIIDAKLFASDQNIYVDFTFEDENGDAVDGKIHTFVLPKDDSKVRRFI